MKGTIVAQVDSSESFQEFCSTSCLSFYEDKQNPSKGILNKSRCTICGKLTEVCLHFSYSLKHLSDQWQKSTDNLIDPGTIC